MSETVELTELYSALEASALAVGVSASREAVRPVLTAYQDALAQSVISFRAQTGARGAGDLDCRITLLPRDLDPYAIAVANGLTPKTDHAVGSLLGEVHSRFPVDCYGVDFGAVGGFKKAWSFFRPDARQSLAEIAGLPSMPRSASGNLGLFEQYGLTDKVSVIGYDYANRSVNVYFTGVPEHCFESQGLRSILRDTGLPEPSEEMLRFGEQAFALYVTLNWDSPKIERVTYSVNTPDPLALPVQIDPAIERLVKDAPYGSAGHRFVYGVTVTPKGEYHKIQKYYQWQTRVEKMLSADAG
ncbi:prenyltransferase [Streptomyces sp. AV19]|uniref:aromatic prenyltransferase n=1 Tax=Streptomyces sp. AV19 TaxID=2793068 RepID=UPI0018FE6497|nr:aromatic prenyltransferase [Streptomyces sp. AV19]MBH1935831.1 prenyltransferase [Streptomyces sp. AV19]MDG4534026.1 aromatic prenyltransferase [Streptomyces sp. AV19]